MAPCADRVALFGFTLSERDEFAATLADRGSYNTLPLEILRDDDECHVFSGPLCA